MVSEEIFSKIDEIIEKEIYREETISKLGFFSCPTKITLSNGKDVIVKVYKPIRNKTYAKKILDNHNSYVKEMIAAGIKIPKTEIFTKEYKSKSFLIITQNAFEKSELVRPIMIDAEIDTFLDILNLILTDAVTFWSGKTHPDLGFHPTLRNYAIRENSLRYFDTFPPMLMSQKELNRVILYMAPISLFVSKMCPSVLINRISNEYYNIDKMIVGIVGSCCRLRPEFANQILSFAKDYFASCDKITDNEREMIISQIKTPPRLPGIWLLGRRILGKEGKPNISLAK